MELKLRQSFSYHRIIEWKSSENWIALRVGFFMNKIWNEVSLSDRCEQKNGSQVNTSEPKQRSDNLAEEQIWINIWNECTHYQSEGHHRWGPLTSHSPQIISWSVNYRWYATMYAYHSRPWVSVVSGRRHRRWRVWPVDQVEWIRIGEWRRNSGRSQRCSAGSGHSRREDLWCLYRIWICTVWRRQ